MKKPETKEEAKKIEYVEVNSFSVEKPRQLKSGAVAFDLTLNGIKIYGVMVVEGKKGDFLSFPQRAGNDGKYYSIVWCPLTQQDQDNIISEVERALCS